MPTKKYVLLSGTHIVGDVAYHARDPQNNVVESEQPLDELMPEKFKLQSSSKSNPNPSSSVSPQRAEGDELDSMNITRLKKLAKEEGVEIKAGMKRKDLVEAIRTAQAEDDEEEEYEDDEEEYEEEEE